VKPAPGAASKRAMSVNTGPHKVNIDAIQEGVEAFLETYPHPPAERKPPRGAHAVLWVDDYWRGVDMAHEALLTTDMRQRPRRADSKASAEDLVVEACKAALHALANDGASIALSDEINPHAVEAFTEAIASIYATGDADEPGYANNDPELAAEAFVVA